MSRALDAVAFEIAARAFHERNRVLDLINLAIAAIIDLRNETGIDIDEMDDLADARAIIAAFDVNEAAMDQANANFHDREDD